MIKLRNTDSFGLASWKIGKTYKKGEIVIGSDGNDYTALKDNIGIDPILPKNALSLSQRTENDLVFATTDAAILGLTFSDDGLHLYACGVAGTIFTDNMVHIDVAVPFDLSTADLDNFEVFDTSGQTDSPSSLVLKPDGTKIFLAGGNTPTIFEYTLSTPFEFTSVLLTGTLSTIGASRIDPTALDFSPDGLQVYIMGLRDSDIRQFTLSIPWDIDSLVSEFSTPQTQEASSPSGISFNKDGSILYMIGRTTNNVFQYDVQPAFDSSSIVFSGFTRSLNPPENAPTDIYLREDFSNFYIAGAGTDKIYEYSLALCWALVLNANEGVLISHADSLYNDTGTTPNITQAGTPILWELANKIGQSFITLPFEDVFFAKVGRTLSIATLFDIDNGDNVDGTVTVSIESSIDAAFTVPIVIETVTATLTSLTGMTNQQVNITNITLLTPVADGFFRVNLINSEIGVNLTLNRSKISVEEKIFEI